MSADCSADVPSSPLLHRHSCRMGKVATKPALHLQDVDVYHPAMKGIADTAYGQPSPARNLTVSDKWGLQRQKISFNTFWWASYKVCVGGVSAAESIWSALYLNIFGKKNTASWIISEVTIYTHTHQHVSQEAPALLWLFLPLHLGEEIWIFPVMRAMWIAFLWILLPGIRPDFSKIYYEFIMKDLIWDSVSSGWPAILVDVFALSRDMQSKWAGKKAGKASQDSMAAGTVMRDSI